MKLSETTIDILSNFSAINPNLLFKEGNVISTLSEAKNIMASATIEERITRKFGIYDLSEFLSTISLIGEPTLDLGESSVKISGPAGDSIEYFYTNESNLTTPTKNVSMPKADVKLTVTADAINKIKKAASVLGHSSVQFVGKNGKISCQVFDPNNSTANKYTLVMDEQNASKEVFSFVIAIGNLKMLAGDYSISFSSKLISHFKNTSTPVEYWIALEKSSTFGS
jgi:hypothetical protein